MIVKDEEIFFVDYLKDPSKVIFYAPLRSYLALVKKEVKENFLSTPESEVQSFILEKLKKRNKINITKVIDDIHDSIPEISLALTDNCNIRCVYCHAAAGEPHKQMTMDKKLVNTVIEKYFERLPTNKDQLYVNIAGGGEPTFDFELLKFSVEKAKECAAKKGVKNVMFRLATNGVYGNKVRKFLTDNFSNISLSFDGPAFIQDVHRPIANGKGSFEAVFQTAKYFQEHKANFAIRATVSDYSLPHIMEIVDFFNTNFPNRSIGFETLVPLGRGANSNIKPPNPKLFSDKMIEVLEYTKDKKIKISNSAWSEYDNIRPVFCSAVGVPDWTVMIDGSIYCCSRDGAPDDFKIGKFNFTDNSIEFYEDRIENVKKMNVLNYPECADCFCKYHCAGDCPDRRLTNNLNCGSVKKIGQHILNDKINQ